MKWQIGLKNIFGSLAAVARLVGVTPHAVRNWRNGVPERHQQKIIDAAKERGFDITVKQLRGKK